MAKPNKMQAAAGGAGVFAENWNALVDLARGHNGSPIDFQHPLLAAAFGDNSLSVMFAGMYVRPYVCKTVTHRFAPVQPVGYVAHPIDATNWDFDSTDQAEDLVCTFLAGGHLPYSLINCAISPDGMIYPLTPGPPIVPGRMTAAIGTNPNFKPVINDGYFAKSRPNGDDKISIQVRDDFNAAPKVNDTGFAVFLIDHWAFQPIC